MPHRDDRTDSDERLVPSSPPPEYVTVRRWKLSTAQEITQVRRELREAIGGDGSPARGALAVVPERMILVASELAANAVEHGRPPTIVTLGSDGARNLLEVADHDPRSIPVLAGRRAPGAGGFGLQIARRLGQEVGWYTTRTTKHIWVTFLPQAPAAAGA
ncbi:ATP-binding protein [Georgenia satyanarayanai]|uniref:ATP-binding protein n=1 Tax=Georgenia satyanarayanai TaxID=860221 RepID=UPI00203D99F3|nr:ATP-binding protein [Georgenia satyanarayanai]MCM3660195.1 ATP-binding protein [Georgenia satyanarayanai]